MERVEGLFFKITREDGKIALYPVFEINEQYHYIKDEGPVMITDDPKMGDFVIRTGSMPLDNDPESQKQFNIWLEEKRPNIGTHFNTIKDNQCTIGLDNNCPNMPVEDVNLLFEELTDLSKPK